MLKVECPECKTNYSVDDSKLPRPVARLSCAKCKKVFEFSVASDGPTRPPSGPCMVVIAIGDVAVCDLVEDVLKGYDLDVLKAYDGVEALKVIEKAAPHVAILDVALPRMYGFEVCSHIRDNADLKETKVILMAAIYNKVRFKRNPSSLYGADDYIERHHIHDKLIEKIHSLVGLEGDGSAGSAAAAAGNQPEAAATPGKGSFPAVKKEDAERLGAAEKPIAPEDVEAQLKARKLARIIVSDIALYNSEHVEEGIRNGTFYRLVEQDIRDGIKYFKNRVPGRIPAGAYFKDALEEFVSRKKKEFV